MSIAQYSMRNRSVVWFILVLFIVGGVWAFLQMDQTLQGIISTEEAIEVETSVLEAENVEEE